MQHPFKIYNLPDDLISGTREENSVGIYIYNSDQNTLNNRIILHQNMINLLISGTKTIVYAQDTTTIHAGEFVILSSGNCLTSEAIPGDRAFSSVLIYFSNKILSDFFIKYQHLYQERRRTEKNPFLTYLQDVFVSNYISSLEIMLQSAGFSPELRRLKLEELLLYLLNKDAEKLRSLLVVSKDDEDLQIRKAVENKIGQPTTVAELAFLCNSSISTFKRKFEKIYGAPPQHWLLQQKMKLAAEMLTHPNERPCIVYQKIGYENYTSFSKAFKKKFGVTPRVYWEQNMDR